MILYLAVLENFLEATYGVIERALLRDVIYDYKPVEALVLRNHGDAVIVVEALRIDEVALIGLIADVQRSSIELYADGGLL